MRWRIQARRGRMLEALPDGELRAQILTENFECPNPDDSFRSLLEQVLEEIKLLINVNYRKQNDTIIFYQSQ